MRCTLDVAIMGQFGSFGSVGRMFGMLTLSGGSAILGSFGAACAMVLVHSIRPQMITRVKRKLRRMRQLLVNSRYALEQTSRKAPSAWLGDLLFMLSCRRIIMLNELDRELGQFHVPAKPDAEAVGRFKDFPPSLIGSLRYVDTFVEEESMLMRELETLNLEPGLHGHTRNAISSLILEVKASLKDIGFMRQNHPGLSYLKDLESSHLPVSARR